MTYSCTLPSIKRLIFNDLLFILNSPVTYSRPSAPWGVPVPAPSAASWKTPWKSAAAPASSGAAAPAFTPSEFPTLAPAAMPVERRAYAAQAESAAGGKRAQQQRSGQQAKVGKQNSTAAGGRTNGPSDAELENDLNAWCLHELSILGVEIDCTMNKCSFCVFEMLFWYILNSGMQYQQNLCNGICSDIIGLRTHDR